MDVLRDKKGRSNIRLIILVFVVLTGIVAALLYFPPILTRTTETRTSGEVTFTDGGGNLLSGTVTMSVAGAPQPAANAYSVSWDRVPNAGIYFDALAAKSIAVNFRISGDSHRGKVMLENYAIGIPNSVNTTPLGILIKYVEINATGVSFSEAEISIKYTNEELNGVNESSLVIYRYDNATQTWSGLATGIDANNNIAGATVNSLSVFALSTRMPEQIEVRDTKKMPVISNIKTYDEAKNLKKAEKTNVLLSSDVPEMGELEVDALASKNVAVKLKVKAINKGEIVLDDFGKKNPVSVPLPGRVVKFVEIGAKNISYSSVEITIKYTDAELNGADESLLIIYHWNGASWDALPTSVDAANNVLTATTTTLSPFAVSEGEGGQARILVATNRFVILDDPNKPAGAKADTANGFTLPANDWNSAYWSGINTKINATALYVDKNGTPVNGSIVTFRLYWPNGTEMTTAMVNRSTDKYGLANFSYDLNAANYYGKWQVRAENGTLGMNTTFIYNWWGCTTNPSGCSEHSTPSPPSDKGTTTANSPYLSGDDPITTVSNHAVINCTVCHQSFDGKPGNNISYANNTNFANDTHRNIRCDNANCHGSYTTHNTNQLVYSCYNSGCHGNASAWDRKDISNKSTLNSGTVSTAVSLYSYKNGSSFNATFHTPNSTVPCIICHGPMHNITKPNATQRFTRNQATESEQCTACHSSYNKHNNTVNCTLCHSDDVHAIKVFAQNATYVNLTRSAPNPARGNCTNCHQNATFFAALNNTATNPKVGNYSGRNPPVIPNPVQHSNDPGAGKKWNSTTGYWTNGTSGSAQLSSCKYCHGETNHKTAALGRPSLWDGNNVVNSSLAGNTTWCSGCHWQGYANGTNTSNDMVTTFTGDSLLVPPEITGNAVNGANTSIYEYTNHSLYTSYYPNLNDSACNRCHGYQYGFTRITQLVHNQSRVGGANCVDCHDIGGIALVAHVNVTAANDTSAIHKNLNINASGTNSTTYYNNSKRCWACHSNGSEPSTPNAHPTSYKMPENCTDCHIQSATQNLNYTPNNTLLNVSEHYWNATEIHTPAVATCYACHNKSEMLIAASDPDAGSGAVYGGANGGNNSTSHYGMKRADLRNGINATCTYCHQNASTAFLTAMLNPSYNSSISNHSLRYSSSNPNCTSSQCHSTGWIHNSTLTRTSITLPNSTFCLNCHGRNSTTGLINFTGAITSIKQKHNNTISCTECHLSSSRDIHPAKYLQSNTSYNTSNSTAVDCINCHQNLTVYPSLSITPPKIPNPMHHSDKLSNGTLWNTTGYWTNNTVTSCTYCHNDTKHNATALGRPAYWKGDNVVNSSITSASNWCAGCHWRGYSSGAKSYNDMTSVFTTANLPVPPEITNGTYAPYNFSRYYNHSLTNYTDAACKPCHGINLTSGKITAFVHNITWGSCTDCHYSFSAMNITTRPDRYVNSTMFNASPHGGVACSNCHTKGHKNIGARKACEDCHAYQQAPLTDRNRHNITGAPGSGVVANTDCTSCHDATLYNNAINNYGYNKTRDCDYCHTYPDKMYS